MALGQPRTTTFRKETSTHCFIIWFGLAQLLIWVCIYFQEHVFSTDIEDLNTNIYCKYTPFSKVTLYITYSMRVYRESGHVFF